MSAEKNNGNKERKIAGGCCVGMAEMMGECCPNGLTNSDCFTWMKEMGKFRSPEKSEPANRKKQGSKSKRSEK